MTKKDQNGLEMLLQVLEHNGRHVLPGSVPEIADGDDEVTKIVNELSESAPAMPPPDDLFMNIETELDTPGTSDIETLKAADGRWIDQGQGVWCKVSASLPDGKRVYFLRCFPGAVLPAHTHSGWEYAVVLEGSYQIEGRTIRAGDAQLSAANSTHPEITTDAGCLLLVVA